MPIPVIVLSNLGEQHDISRAKSLGASEFFVKAMLTPDQIVVRIESVLAAAAQQPPAQPPQMPPAPPVPPAPQPIVPPQAAG